MPTIAKGVSWETGEGDLSVRLQVLEPAAKISADEVVRSLQRAGIQAEADPAIVRQALMAASGEWVPIALGTSPTPPVHGRLEFYVDPGSLDRTPEVDANDRIDYKNLKLFLNVEEGTELVRKHDPILGKPGIDVYGKTIPPEEARIVKLPVGDGIKIVEDGYLAVASVSGAVAMVDDRLTVMKMFHVPGDVNYKTGNIDFNGNVDISQDVLTGFQVKATGNIVVRGVVEASYVEAKGDIQIFGGFQGDKKGVLKAGGNIKVAYASEGTLEAGGSVLVRSHLLNCQVTAGVSVEAEGAKGTIAGGEIRAVEKIVSAMLGSEAGVKTVVQIGQDQELPAKIQAAQEIIVALLKVKRSIGHRKNEIEKMRKDLEKAWEGQVVAKKILYPGVLVRFPGTEFEVKDPLNRKTITCSKGRIETDRQDQS